jgi:hypothetical protein
MRSAAPVPGRHLASTPSWVKEDWGRVTTPEVWERNGWRD